LNKYKSRLDEYIKRNQANKQGKSVFLWGIFLVAVTLTFFMAFELEDDFSISSILNSLIFAVGIVVIPPLVHIVLASMSATQRNNRARKKIIVAWLIFSILIQVFALVQMR